VDYRATLFTLPLSCLLRWSTNFDGFPIFLPHNKGVFDAIHSTSMAGWMDGWRLKDFLSRAFLAGRPAFVTDYLPDCPLCLSACLPAHLLLPMTSLDVALLDVRCPCHSGVAEALISQAASMAIDAAKLMNTWGMPLCRWQRMAGKSHGGRRTCQCDTTLFAMCRLPVVCLPHTTPSLI